MMLGENFCEAHNFDMETLQEQVEKDDYSGQKLVTEPYSTTDFKMMPS